jgi:hypothetical protein
MLMGAGAGLLTGILQLQALGPFVISQNHTTVGALLIFLGGFIVGIPSAIALDPPLPLVTLTTQVDAATKEASPSLRGHLVTHSDGFWHLFDANDELLSIPDEQVLAVRVIRKADTTLGEETAPTKETEPPG